MFTITKDIVYVGVDDYMVDLFESQYDVPNGMAYNSYVIVDDKIAVVDTVEKDFGEEWMAGIKVASLGRTPDYLIVQHMEPDHSGNISTFMSTYPNATIVATQKAFAMMENFYGSAYEDRRIVAAEGSTLSLGRHELTFVTAPMVHWPEVMVTYDSTDKVLFSADGFGKFGAMGSQESWNNEARRYYFGIVGKFGVPVQTLLKKAATLDIQLICPLHGPIIKEDVEHVLNLYAIWSSYTPETDGVLIAYTSVYGHTEQAAELLAEELRKLGCTNVVLNDLSRCDMSKAISNAFQYSKTVFATTTYNSDIFPPMNTFIHSLVERSFQNRKVAFVENGSWAPTAMKVMKGLLENSKNLTYCENNVTLKSNLSEENKAQIAALAAELMAE